MPPHPTREEFDRLINHILGERLVGRPRQGIDTLSAVQNYRTGARLQLGNRIYHYAHAGAAILDSRVVFMENPQDAGLRVIGLAAVAGVSSVTLTVNNTEGPEQDGSVPLNYLEGGTVVLMTALGTYNRGILGNAVKAAGTGTLVVDIDAPTSFAIAITDSTEILASKYARVCLGADTVEGALLSTGVGVPTLTAADGDWLWLQTWGPLWTVTDLTLSVGNDNRSGFVHGDGSIQDFAASGGAFQRAGTVLANAVGGGQGAPFFNLELDP